MKLGVARAIVDGNLVDGDVDIDDFDLLVACLAGADLFACECYVFDKDVPLHNSYARIVEHRDQLTCKQLILTHMSEEMLARAADLDLPTAEDGLAVVL